MKVGSFYFMFSSTLIDSILSILTIGPCLDAPELLEEELLAAAFELLDEALAVGGHLARGLLQLRPVDLHPRASSPPSCHCPPW